MEPGAAAAAAGPEVRYTCKHPQCDENNTGLLLFKCLVFVFEVRYSCKHPPVTVMRIVQNYSHSDVLPKLLNNNVTTESSHNFLVSSVLFVFMFECLF